MKVSELMSRDVEFIDAESSAMDAAVMMGELDVGSLPVGTDAALDGIVTDRDLLYRVVARGLDPRTTRLREVLSRPAITCGEDETVAQAMDRMAANHVRRLPVRDVAGRISGWITLADLSRKLLVESDVLQDALRRATEAAAEVKA